MLKIKIIAEVEIFAAQKELLEVTKNAMKTIREKFEDEEGSLKAEPEVTADQSNGGVVTIRLRSEDEQ